MEDEVAGEVGERHVDHHPPGAVRAGRREGHDVALTAVVESLTSVQRSTLPTFGSASTRSQSIRTRVRLALEVDLVDLEIVPVYVDIAEEASRLRDLGMTFREIGRALNVDPKTAAKACQWWNEVLNA